MMLSQRLSPALLGPFSYSCPSGVFHVVRLSVVSGQRQHGLAHDAVTVHAW